MRVVAPFTIDHPPTMHALLSIDAEHRTRWRLDGPDDYLRCMEQQWERGESFVNIEHDVEFAPSQYYNVALCPHQWCWTPYVGVTEPQKPNLGLTKFSATFISMNRMMWVDFASSSRVQRVRWQRQPTWSMLDWWVTEYMADRMPKPHAHYPGVVNRRPAGVDRMRDDSMAGFLHG
jgi:hypothetical protein